MKRLLKKLFKYLLIAILLIALTILLMGYQEYKSVTREVSIQDKLDQVMDNPFYLSHESIPDVFLDAIVAVEDERYFTRKSTLDKKAVLRAITVNLKNRSYIEGASTIPQQVAKNFYFSHDVTPSRKVAEYFIAKDLLKIADKEDILETYVNIIYYGNGAYSIGEAAAYYFDLPADKLNEGELTILAGLPNAPSVYDLTQNFNLAKQRQRHVLFRMVEMEKITQIEANEIYRMEVYGYE